jgi:hypothetical protein
MRLTGNGSHVVQRAVTEADDEGENNKYYEQ